MPSLAGTTGACSVVGGAAWTAACFVHNSLPQGCIDTSCAGRAMRTSTSADSALFTLAGLMLAATFIGLLLLARRHGGGRGPVAAAAAITGAAGLTLLLAAGVTSAFIDNNWEGMPGLVIPGVALLTAGLALVGLVLLRVRVLPRGALAVLLLTVVILPFANEQTSRILVAVPFGLAWLGAGVLLLRTPDGTRAAALS